MRLLALAVTVLIGCGNVAATASDARPGDGATGDAASNPCAPATCLLSDDFDGTSLDTSKWGMTASAGATITVASGQLTIKLPAVANAFADVHSLAGFPVGATLEATVTFSPGQVADHKGAGFASDRVGSGCEVGETDSAMFRGQDGDAYIETKAANTASCTKTTTMYPGGTSKLKIARMGNQVVFTQNGAAQPAVTANVPVGLLPVRFSAYTFTTTGPPLPVEIDVDTVFVRPPP